jgi:hypothetical protein
MLAIDLRMTYDEGVLLFSEGLLVDETGPSQYVGSQVVNAVLRRSSAHQLQSLHVPPLGSPQCQNAVLCENIQTQRVDALLVDEHEILLRIAPADVLLQFHNFLQLCIDEPSLALDKLVSLLSAGVEKARVDLRLLVLQAHVECEYERILHALGHIWMPRTVVQRQSSDELRVYCSPVLHGHDLNHEQIGLRGRLVDGQHSVGDIRSELLCESRFEFRGE